MSSVLRSTIFLMFLGAVVSVLFEFISDPYNTDIGHELYYGQELARGNLIWTHEFHDKLPALQLAFLIPGQLGSVPAWRVLSLSAVLLASFITILLLPKILVQEGWSSRDSELIARFAGVLFILLSVSAPSGLTHINALAASAAAVATLVVPATLAASKSRWSLGFGLVVGSLLAAVSISVRPYFLLPLVFTFVLTLLSCQRGSKPPFGIEKRALFGLTLAILTAFFGFVLNLAPYLVLNEGQSFIDGISYLLDTRNPNSAVSMFLDTSLRLQLFFLAFGLLALVSLIRAIWHQEISLRLVTIPLSTLLLSFSVVSAHFWDHYTNLFSWYFSLLLAFYAVEAKQFLLSIRLRRALKPLAVVPIVFTAVVMTFGSVVLAIERYANPQEVKHTSLINSFQQHLSGYDQRPSFLAPSSMELHWTLREPRHGFPHEVHSGNIASGRWASTKGSPSFLAPKSYEEYCAALEVSEVDIIVTDAGGLFDDCVFDTFWSREQIKLWDASGHIANVWSREQISEEQTP